MDDRISIPSAGNGVTGDRIAIPNAGDGVTDDRIAIPCAGDGVTDDRIAIPNAGNGVTGGQIAIPCAGDGVTGGQIAIPCAGDGFSDNRIAIPDAGNGKNGESDADPCMGDADGDGDRGVSWNQCRGGCDCRWEVKVLATFPVSQMAMTQLQRLLYLQGNTCFFCQEELPPGEASVEHLVAKANGGTDAANNLVACCEALNKLFGSMSLKEKLAAVLNQKGAFVCPKRQAAAPTKKTHPPSAQGAPHAKPAEAVPAVSTAIPAQLPSSPKANGSGQPLVGNRGKKWTDEEKRALGEGHDRGLDIGELASLLQRGAGAVISQLVKLGRKPVTLGQIAAAEAATGEGPSPSADTPPPPAP